MNAKNPKINLNKSLIYFLDRTPIPFFLPTQDSHDLELPISPTNSHLSATGS